MIPLAQRYLLGKFLATFLICTFFLTMLLWLNMSLSLMDRLIVRYTASFADFLRLVPLLVPGNLLTALPLSLLVATNVTMAHLKESRAAIVLLNAGMAPTRLLRPFLIVGALCLGASYAIYFFVLPGHANRIKNTTWQMAKTAGSNNLRGGQFVHLSDRATFFAEKKQKNGLLENILIFYLHPQTYGIDTYFTHYARLERQENGARIDIDAYDGTLYRGTRLAEVTQSSDFDKAHITLYPEAPQQRPYRNSLSEFTFADLWQGADDRIPPRGVEKFRAEAHRRLAHGLYSITAMLIAFFLHLRDATHKSKRNVTLAKTCGLVLLLFIAQSLVTALAERSMVLNFLQYALPVSICIFCWLAMDRAPSLDKKSIFHSRRSMLPL